MESPEELLAFHAASRDSILPKSGAFKNIDLSIHYFVAQAVIRELDNRKTAGHADGGFPQQICDMLTFREHQLQAQGSFWNPGSEGVLPCIQGSQTLILCQGVGSSCHGSARPRQAHSRDVVCADTTGNTARKARNAARLLDESELGQVTFESSNDRSKVGKACVADALPGAGVVSACSIAAL